MDIQRLLGQKTPFFIDLHWHLRGYSRSRPAARRWHFHPAGLSKVWPGYLDFRSGQRTGLCFPIRVTASLQPDTWVFLSQLSGEDTAVQKGEMVYQDQRMHTLQNLVTPSPLLSPWTLYVPLPQLRWPWLAPGPRTSDLLWTQVLQPSSKPVFR